MVEQLKILLLGSLDTKSAEYQYVAERLQAGGHDVLVADTSVLEYPVRLTPDITAAEIASAGGTAIEDLRSLGDRGVAMNVMAEGAAVVALRLYEEHRISGILGMGGTGGTSVISAAMRELPIGFPKVLVSTAAAGDTRPIVGTRDIVLIPSVVDVAGLNRISKLVFAEAAAAMIGLVNAASAMEPADKPVVALSMFGNTTPCVDACREALTNHGYEVLVFHATGTGGRVMEDLVSDGLISGVLDITTTELADELCGGVFSAGPKRLDAPGRMGIPHLVAPGCLDMVNFGARETVPSRYSDRRFHVWNPNVTLMRTNVEENSQLGRMIAQKVNNSSGLVGVIVPLEGVSMLDSEGNDFWWPEADKAIFDAFRKELRNDIPYLEVPANINDEVFSRAAVGMFLDLMGANS